MSEISSSVKPEFCWPTRRGSTTCCVAAAKRSVVGLYAHCGRDDDAYLGSAPLRPSLPRGCLATRRAVLKSHAKKKNCYRCCSLGGSGLLKMGASSFQAAASQQREKKKATSDDSVGKEKSLWSNGNAQYVIARISIAIRVAQSKNNKGRIQRAAFLWWELEVVVRRRDGLAVVRWAGWRRELRCHGGVRLDWVVSLRDAACTCASCRQHQSLTAWLFIYTGLSNKQNCRYKSNYSILLQLTPFWLSSALCTRHDSQAPCRHLRSTPAL